MHGMVPNRCFTPMPLPRRRANVRMKHIQQDRRRCFAKVVKMLWRCFVALAIYSATGLRFLTATTTPTCCKPCKFYTRMRVNGRSNTVSANARRLPAAFHWIGSVWLCYFTLTYYLARDRHSPTVVSSSPPNSCSARTSPDDGLNVCAPGLSSYRSDLDVCAPR